MTGRAFSGALKDSATDSFGVNLLAFICVSHLLRDFLALPDTFLYLSKVFGVVGSWLERMLRDSGREKKMKSSRNKRFQIWCSGLILEAVQRQIIKSRP